MWCIYIYIYIWILAIKKNGILPFAATWMDLEIIILSEISQTEKDKYYMISLLCGILKKWYKWTYLQNRNRVTNFKKNLQGLPWWRSGWESACQCRGHGFAPWSGKIPHAAEQLGLWATIAEPAPLEPVICNKRGRDSERPAHRDEEWPPLAATREGPRTETKTQHSQKNKIKINK